LQINDTLYELKNSMQLTHLSDKQCRVGLNLFMEHPVVAPDPELRSILTQEILEGLYGDIRNKLALLQITMQTDVLAADEQLKTLIHNMRF